jgi:glycosyltransferase involved in cell wall biosynthesis
MGAMQGYRPEHAPVMPMTRISIIVSFYQRIAHLRCCLAALQRCREDFHEVIIADDGSEAAVVDQVRRLADEAAFPVRHVWQPKDGFRLSANRNNGIRAASGDHLLFIDCDFVLLPGAVRAHLSAARPGRFTAAYCKYLPEAASSRLLQALPEPAELESIYDGLEDRPITRAHRKFIWYSILIRLGLARPRKLRCSSHFSISRRDMEAINGYDERFRGWGGEDEDLALRMMLAGYQPRSVISRARTLHVWHPSELGGRHWSQGSNVEYLNRSGVTARCTHGLVSDPA